MKVCGRRFNLFLVLAALVLLGACRTDRQEKETSALRIYLETAPTGNGLTQTISVLRADPLMVTIATMPILTEASVVAARILEAPGGFGLEIRFDENGSWILEQYSAANPGRHFVVFGQWGASTNDSRWLAAPVITRRLANGVLAFTPDMSRAEAERFVLGLNNVARQNAKDRLK